jgi:hypothetical protein
LICKHLDCQFKCASQPETLTTAMDMPSSFVPTLPAYLPRRA